MIIGCNFIRAMYGGVRIEGDNVTFYKNVITIQTRQSVNLLDMEEDMNDEDFIVDHYYEPSSEWIFHSVVHNPAGPTFEERHSKLMKQLQNCGIIGEDPMKYWSLNQITCKLDLKNIKEWYEKSGTSRLSYLDLATTEKPSTKELAHNIAVIYDRVCLSSKVNLKEFHDQQTQINSLENSIHQLSQRIEKLEKGISSLTQVCIENQPLTRRDLQEKFKQVEELLHHIKGSLIE